MKRHFLGWDGPAVEKVADWLLGGRKNSGPVDFQDTLIVVPTLQAGRRLREVLAWRCHEHNAALLSASIVTPHYLFSRFQPGIETANPVMTRAAWTAVLEKADLAEFSGFFPRPQKLNAFDKFQWALATGEMIERLRQELADGGYSISDVIGRHGAELQEPERWNDLARLEDLYFRQLDEVGFADACRAKMELAEDPLLEPFIKQIVIACVPDPSLLAVRALANLARTRSVEILVHAPDSKAGSFDEWGRPIPAEWASEEIDIPGWDENVFLEASPDAQGRRVAELLAGLPSEYGPADIGLGTPDPSVIPFLEKELRAIGVPAFNPADAPFRECSLGRLLDHLFNLLQSRAYVHAADLLRHPDFLSFLRSSHEIEPRELLSQLDRFQNYRLPMTLENMLAPFSASGGEGPALRNEFPALNKALGIVREQAEAFERESLENACRSFLKSVYAARRIRQDSAEDRDFSQAAALLEDTFREMREFPRGEDQSAGRNPLAIFIRRFRERAYHRERAHEIVDLQGWLELPWTDTPFLAVTGMNEEFVPGGSLGDVFLPDSLRKILQLRDDLSRFGRDVYLLRTLVESRRREGRLCLIAGKRSLAGDPLRPSRLLFRCAADVLPARARGLFKSIRRAEHIPAAETIFRLKPSAGGADDRILEKKVLSVTAFRDYLACPFRFYLRHVLRMEPLSDGKSELDALDFGSLIHEVLQVMGSDRRLWACGDAGRLHKELSRLADDKAAGRYGTDLPLGALAALSAAQARLGAFSVKQVELARAGWEIISVEQKKSVSRKGFSVRGMIDRVDRHVETGAIRIIDYKTSDTEKSPWDAHLAKRRETSGRYDELVAMVKSSRKGEAKKAQLRWTDLQLPLYSLLYNGNNDFDPKIEPAYFNLPKAVGETGLAAWEDFNLELLESAVACMDGVLDDIASRRFWPPSEAVRYDDFEALFLDSPEKVFDIEGFVP